MKKKLAIKFAALMLVITDSVAMPMINFPNSFLLWGEPTPPKKNNK